MNILHIAGKMDPRLGGVAQAIRTIIRGLEGMGIHNEAVTLDNPQSSFLTEEPLVIHTPGEGRGAWYYTSRFIPWLEEIVPALISSLYTACGSFTAMRYRDCSGS